MDVKKMIVAVCCLTAVAGSSFTLVSPETKARIVVGASEPDYVWRAAQDLTNDVKKIAGADLALVRGDSAGAGNVFIVTQARTEIEAYDVEVKGGTLFVSGSDARGTMFGLYDFIERYLKVDPLSFWNGASYTKSETLAWKDVKIHQASPTFRFRGWFINDEDLLTAWLPSGGKRSIDYPYYSTVVNPLAMERIAEALVRCRYNLIIPASFINIMNPPEARLLDICSKRGIYLSMHHVEPMGVSAFTFFNYWKDRGRNLEYSYASNPKEVEETWRAAAKEWAKFPDVVWQIGLRGIADRPLWKHDPKAPKTDEGRAALISRAMARQLEILDEIGVPKAGRHVSTTLWAEGSVFNQRGLLYIPKGTTVVFSDNCSGWMWQKDFHETQRTGDHSYGVYYHHGIYSSGPHLASLVPAAKTYSLLKQARGRNSAHYAIFNVSNIREFTYGIDATARMLWNLDSFNPEDWTKDWIARHYSARREDWLTAYNTYYHALVMHPVSGLPLFLEGLMQKFGRRTLARLEREIETGPKISPEPFERIYGNEAPKDAFSESLKAMFDSGLENERDAYARLAPQTATYALAAEIARSLYSGLPQDEREFAFTTLVYPAELMRDFSEWLGETIRAHASYETGNKEAACNHLAVALSRMDAIISRAEHQYCTGRWENWYRDCRKINPRALRERTFQIMEKLKGTVR